MISGRYMNYKKSALLGGLLALSIASTSSWAAVSSAEASRLGQTLTPFGSPKAGNESGTIPEWTGGITKPPAGYSESGQHHIDPFPNDEVLFTITAANKDQYAAHLSDGVLAMLETYPTRDRKSTRLNSSHVRISYAVFCLK